MPIMFHDADPYPIEILPSFPLILVRIALSRRQKGLQAGLDKLTAATKLSDLQEQLLDQCLVPHLPGEGC